MLSGVVGGQSKKYRYKKNIRAFNLKEKQFLLCALGCMFCNLGSLD